MTHPTTYATDQAFGDSGLTIREYFAALALLGSLSSCTQNYPNAEEVAKKSVEYADVLIKELNKNKTEK